MSFVYTVNPNGGVIYKRVVEVPFSKNHLLERIFSAENIRRAWKQWRYTRTKVRNLLKLGTSKRQAIMTSLSRRGPWHLSRIMAAQSGMTNKWLSEQGLISVKEQWVKIHYPATAR